MTSKVNLQVHHVRFFEYQPMPINCIAFEETSKRVAVSRSDGSIQILSTVDNWVQELNFPGGVDASVEALVWSQQRLFAAGLGGNVVELDLDTELVKDSVSSNAGPVWCLTGNKEGTRLAAGTEDGCLVLFNIEDELRFSRAFGKQEGRILSIAWYSNSDGDNIIITGGTNNIRQWSVNSGQPISRMTLGQNSNKDTIVWCLTVTQDFTIISGDSRGVVTFWNGKFSTQIKAFHCHKADVLCLCLSQDECTVYSGGVDSAVNQFTFYAPDPNSERRRWIHQLLHGYHTHDVRAITYAQGCVASGGVDCALRVAKLEDPKQVRPISPFPSEILVDLDKENKLVLLQYRKYLELWQLGAAEYPNKLVEGILPLTKNPVKLIQLKAREGQEITCSALSSTGMIVFSDQHQVRLYRFSTDESYLDSSKLHLERVKHTFPHPAKMMRFTPSGDHLVAVLVGSGLEIMNTKNGTIQHKLKTDSTIHLLAVSPDNRHIAYATVNHKIYISDVTTGQEVCQCPVMSSQVSALAFSPHNQCLVISYCNHKVYEMDIEKKEYSKWCRSFSHTFPTDWLQSYKTVRRISFHPDNTDQIFLHTDSCLAVLDRRLKESEKMTMRSIKQVVRKCSKYKYLLFAEFLQDGTLVVVERPPSMIDEQLPPSLKQKKFGIA